jgi:hypothetical protein
VGRLLDAQQALLVEEAGVLPVGEAGVRARARARARARVRARVRVRDGFTRRDGWG